MARIALAHGARPRRVQARAVAHDVIDFGLAEHLVHRHAELLLAIGEHRIAHRLARAHDGLQSQAVVALAARGTAFIMALSAVGKQKGVGDALPLHQLKGHLRAEAAIERHDGAAEIQRGQQGVHQTARPGPVGGRPEHRLRWCCGIEGVKAKPVLAAHKARQVADQGAVGNQRALGVAGGARV